MLNESSVAVLVGMESAGKSTLFSRLTGGAVGSESNVQGTTVTCRMGTIPGSELRLVDTPGIRSQSDCETTRLALQQAKDGDIVFIVVRGTHARSELYALFREVPVLERKLVGFIYI